MAKLLPRSVCSRILLAVRGIPRQANDANVNNYSLIHHSIKKMSSQRTTVKLNDGNVMPIMGLGTGNPKIFPSDPVVGDALEVGFRHFDTAFGYRNQEELGANLKKSLQKLEIKREDVFITTKNWFTYNSRDGVIKNCQDCLRQLQLDYVDLLLVHFPCAFKEGDDLTPTDDNGKPIFSDTDYLETYSGVEECRRKGWAKSVGVCNFSLSQMERLLANCSVKPTVLQVEAHPYLTQEDLLAFCRKHEIVLCAYAPLGTPNPKPMGITTELTDVSIHLLEDPVILDVGKKCGKSPGQVLLRWAVQRGTVPLPRSSKKQRLIENMQVLEFEISPEDMQRISSLNRNQRAYKYEGFKTHKYFFAD